jgi:hypothetical protein
MVRLLPSSGEEAVDGSTTFLNRDRSIPALVAASGGRDGSGSLNQWAPRVTQTRGRAMAPALSSACGGGPGSVEGRPAGIRPRRGLSVARLVPSRPREESSRAFAWLNRRVGM